MVSEKKYSIIIQNCNPRALKLLVNISAKFKLFLLGGYLGHPPTREGKNHTLLTSNTFAHLLDNKKMVVKVTCVIILQTVI